MAQSDDDNRSWWAIFLIVCVLCGTAVYNYKFRDSQMLQIVFVSF